MKGTKITVADDPETLRARKTMEITSEVGAAGVGQEDRGGAGMEQGGRGGASRPGWNKETGVRQGWGK